MPTLTSSPLRLAFSLLFLGGSLSVWAQQAPSSTPAKPQRAPATPPRPAPADSDDATSTVDPKALLDLGKQLFDEYAPEEVKREYEFPSHEQWEAFAARLQQALQGGSLEELAAFEPEVRRALAAFQTLPDYADYADWLAERLDLIETARTAVATKTPPSPSPRPTPTPTPPKGNPTEPTPPVPTPAAPALPYYDLWLERLRTRPRPARADELVPLLKVIFAAEGLPAELAWLAEVESSLNPTARSPAGARGLFQLMPATARSMGLSLLPFDERVHPGKNARAAARLLRKLHDRFESWPLALAAYNAGEGKIAVALKKKDATTFSDIAESLPAETRMYVPKVFATLTVRENVTPQLLRAPTTPPPAQKVSQLPKSSAPALVTN